MNQEELENFIKVYGNDLYSFCCYLTRNRQEADDLYQDTFLKIYETGENLSDKENPKSFLMAISVNIYRNYRRKLSIRQRFSGMELDSEENFDVISSGEIIEDRIVAQEEIGMLQNAVKQLSDKYRIPILLFYMEELQIGDISRIMKLPEGTVKSRIHRAKQILKQKLEEMYYEK